MPYSEPAGRCAGVEGSAKYAPVEALERSETAQHQKLKNPAGPCPCGARGRMP
uniref:BpiB03 n=1 Tax=uncultured organism Bio4 TaxID=460931 RepID=B2BKA6_9ZZZZ|nr:BpiB03 [uncultured organism Bio4]